MTLGKMSFQLEPKDQSGSPLFLPSAELRQNIWRFALPSNQHLIIDPESMDFLHTLHHPVQFGDYGAAWSLITVCQKVHYEVIVLLYSRNVVTVVRPFITESANLENASALALHNIRRFEACVRDRLVELNKYWPAIRDRLPALQDLKLTCYHSGMAEDVIGHLAVLLCSGSNDGSWDLKLELHRSLWSNRYFPFDRNTIASGFYMGEAEVITSTTVIPKQLQTITVAISADDGAATQFETFVSDYGGPEWRFRKDGNKDTASVKYLQWQYRPVNANGNAQDNGNAAGQAQGSGNTAVQSNN